MRAPSPIKQYPIPKPKPNKEVENEENRLRKYVVRKSEIRSKKLQQMKYKPKHPSRLNNPLPKVLTGIAFDYTGKPLKMK